MDNMNIIHADIKPDNMMLDEEGNLILCDFGVSQIFKSSTDLIHGTHGTMLFMAPEMVATGNKKILHGKQVDIWAMGISIFNLVTN